MQVTIVTATARDHLSGSYGWAAAGQSRRGGFRNGGRLAAAPGDESDAQMMAAMNAVYHAIESGQVESGDTLVVGLSDIRASTRLARANRGGSDGSEATKRAADMIAGWREALGLRCEFRCVGRDLSVGEHWQRNASAMMANAAAADVAAPSPGS